MLKRWRVPVVRIRAGDGGVDQYGDPIPGVDERVDLPPCLFAPIPTDYPVTAGVAATVTEPTAYWPREHPDVQAGDRLEIEGTEWTVAGRPARWPLGLSVTLTGTEGV